MEDEYNSRSSQLRKKSPGRPVIYFIITLAVAALGIAFGVTQFLAAQSMREELQPLEERLDQVEQENERLKEQYDEIYEENEKLREENKMLRSETVIDHGSRDTNKVAITINNGMKAELIDQALDSLGEYDIQATLFPMGSWVERQPEVWRRAVKEGHELGNSTYSHPPLTRITAEQVSAEINGWQEAVEEALGEPYHTYFFRPPYGDGFLTGPREQKEQLQELIAEKGMFAVLWDVEAMFALRHGAYTSERITEHVLANARGGSIVLLHFHPEDIAALPDILSGLRDQDLEPCSLSELLLAESQT